MKYLRFQTDHGVHYGTLVGSLVYEIAPHYFGPFTRTGRRFPLSAVRVLAPCVPSKVVALGLNYQDHARELHMPLPLNPLIFIKPSTAVIGPRESIIYPSSSTRVDYEGELAVVIKYTARSVPAARAAGHVLGYTCCNDVTARDLQQADGQWTRAKSFNTFAPLGPWIVDGIDPGKLRIQTFVNGKQKQSSNTSELIFGIPEIISFVSNIMTLLPGDVISTGTPLGVGPMKPGDRVTIKIQKIGELVNTVAAS
jgi:2-keto-4-pentenoate hydratase/2-oxohepta-3-ene-1,7-dioic acid hydratase in catechol pathway